MGVIVPNFASSTEDRTSGALVVDGSLKIDYGKTQYLTRTPGSAGNTLTWTWSGWIRKTKLATTQYLFRTPSVDEGFYISSSDYIDVYRYSGSFTYYGTTPGLYRDPSGWYHVVYTHDATAATGSRLKIYVNGVLQGPLTSLTDISSNTGYSLNTAVAHRIGEVDGYMSQVYFIDGQALTPSYFGYTDPLTNTWRPKSFDVKKSTLNNGTVWSNTLTKSSEHASNTPVSLGFDGITGTGNNNFVLTGGGGTIEWTASSYSFPPNSTVEVWKSNTGGANYRYWNVDTGSGYGSNITEDGNSGWLSLGTLSNIQKIRCVGTNVDGYGAAWGAIRINGITLVDSNGFGANGFYLPLDGNTPIGQDQSGNGNNWTPVNFGGSNTIEKATGALPILNTDGGGKVARPGVFGSEVGEYYAVTVPGGTGGGFYLDGTQKPALSLIRGATYTFDQSDSSNSGHPLVFGTTAEGNDYSDGVTTSGTPGSAGAYTKITVPHNAPDTLYYHCSNHSGMGNSTSQTTDTKKADPYAWKNTLALPLVGSRKDYSNQINSGSTEKVLSIEETPSASSAQSNFYGGSYYFDGNRDHIYDPNSNVADYYLNGVDWTIECWVYPTDVSGSRVIMENTNNGTGGWSLQTNSGEVEVQLASLFDPTPSNAIIANKWTHIAVVRSGSTTTLYLDGISRGTTSTDAGTTSNTSLWIGSRSGGSYSYIGYMSDIRVYKGVAKYTQNFIPASTNPDILPDTPSGVAYSSNVALVPSTDGAVAVTDPGSTNLSIAASNDFNFGTGDFTVEGFFYVDSSGSNNCIIDFRTSGNTNQYFLRMTSATDYDFRFSGSSLGTFTAPSKVWNHIAASRSSGTTKIFVNGIQTNSFADTNNASNTGPVLISTFYDTSGSASSYGFNGYVSNLHVVKGTALYTSNFTPPSAPLTATETTKLLCCQSNTSANTGDTIPSATATLNIPCVEDTFADTSPSNVTITDNSITVTSAGTNSLGITTAASLPGGSDRAIDTRGTSFDRTGIYTIDCYFNYDGTQQGRLITNYNPGTTGNVDGADGQGISLATDGSINIYDYGNAIIAPAGSVTNNVWYHLRFIANNTTIIASYLNGVQQTISNETATPPFVIDNFAYNGPIQYGAGTSGISHTFSGKLGPIRFTPGNLGAPPSGGLVTSDSVISNTPSQVITNNGNAAATNFNPFTANINAVRGQESGYATWNPIGGYNPVGTFSEGNLKFTSASADWDIVRSTLSASTGKFYAEYITVGTVMIGVETEIADASRAYFNSGNGTLAVRNNAASWIDGSSTTTGNLTYTDNDVVGLALDLDNRTFSYYVNGVLGYTYSLPNSSNWNNRNVFFSGTALNNTDNLTANFGQKPFKFPPPAGFQPLALANTPRPSIVRPDQYVGIVTYTGNGGNQTISGLKFSPDFVWVKSRSNTVEHAVADTVRGATNTLFPNNTNVEATSNAGDLQSFTSDGFTISSNARYNELNWTYVAWCWKAGGSGGGLSYWKDDVGYATASAAGLTAGTITPTGVSVGTKQGFSIIAYEGTGAVATVPHGLSNTPGFIIVKDRDSTYNWACWHSGLSGNDYYLFLNNTDGQSNSYYTYWNNTAPTSSVFSLGANSPDTAVNTNKSGDRYIAYCWADIPGVQKFGSYTGNGSTDGPMVVTGFRPKWILTKVSSTGGTGYDWHIFDTERDTYNAANKFLDPNYSGPEQERSDPATITTIYFDILSNGFKVRNSVASANASGQTIIYAAFAEAPTFNLYGAQSNAR